MEVTNEEIAELSADPAALEMAVGDHQPLLVFGPAATSGLQELFPQPDLKVAPRKANMVDVVGGEDVQAKAVGADTIDVAWRNRLKIDVPVNVRRQHHLGTANQSHRNDDQRRPARSLTRFPPFATAIR